MSYYTGSNTVELIPQRLLLAIQSRALNDDEFRDLVRHDIRVAVMHRSELMRALVAAYKKAPPSGRQFMEKALAEFDPSALASIRSEAGSVGEFIAKFAHLNFEVRTYRIHIR